MWAVVQPSSPCCRRFGLCRILMLFFPPLRPHLPSSLHLRSTQTLPPPRPQPPPPRLTSAPHSTWAVHFGRIRGFIASDVKRNSPTPKVDLCQNLLLTGNAGCTHALFHTARTHDDHERPWPAVCVCDLPFFCICGFSLPSSDVAAKWGDQKR